MAALVRAGGAGAAAEAKGAQLGGKAAATDDIDFEAEAQARGMQLLSCTRVRCSLKLAVFFRVGSARLFRGEGLPIFVAAIGGDRSKARGHRG